MDSSEIGRYGTISFMKRNEPDAVVANFPIDEEEVTFGRDPQCSVRLYYKAVSSLHCKIVFLDTKAFIVILGSNGVNVDGYDIYPSNIPKAPNTVPLVNNSKIEIHGKLFRFTYPPKKLRVALMASPSRYGAATTPNRKRALRMSMIQSAQVFSPRPSQDPFQNLRVLQSPLKPFEVPSKRESPDSDSDSDSEDVSDQESEDADDLEDADEEEIVLVDGDCPRVVEEEKDLIILEDVEVEVNKPQGGQQQRNASRSNNVPSSPQSVPRASLPPSSIPPLQTPRRRMPGEALHRAVLIRSAQRAVLKAEIEKEEEQEEQEVEEEVVTEVTADGNHSSENETEEEAEKKDESKEPPKAVSTWRKSLESVGIWPFRSADTIPEQEENQDSGSAEVGFSGYQSHDTSEPAQETSNINLPSGQSGGDEENQIPQSQVGRPSQKRTLGNFMTPQRDRRAVRGGRYSYGAVGPSGEAKRVPKEPTWRVKDIVVPERNVETGIQEEGEEESLDVRDEGQRQRLSEEERKAIQERRRSALNTPDPFFGGQVPGMRRGSSVQASPTKTAGPSSPVKAQDKEDINTRSLLERAKQTVELMKRRKESDVLPPSPTKRYAQGEGISGRFSLLAPEVRDGGSKDDEEMCVDTDLVGVDEKDEAASSGPAADATSSIKVDEPNPTDAPKSPHTPIRTLNAKGPTGGSSVPKAPSKGIKERSAEPRVTPKPVLEGIGEMVATPERSRLVEAAEGTEDVPKKKTTRTKASSSKAPATTRRRTPRTVVTDDTADDNKPKIQDDSAPRANRRGRSGSKQLGGDVEHGDGEGNDVKPRERLLRTANKTAMEEIAEDIELEPPTRAGKLKRGKTTDEDVVLEQANDTFNTKSSNRRKTPKVQETLLVEPEVEPSTTRKVRVKRKVENADDETPKSTSDTSGRRAKREKPVAVEIDDDPLDTIGVDDAEMHNVEEVVVPTAKGRRGARSKTSKVAKEEEAEAEAEMIVAPPPAGKKKITPKTSAKGGSGTGTRSSGRSKKTATAVTTGEGGDKENSGGSVDDDERGAEKAVKVRVSRTKKAKEKSGDVDAGTEKIATRVTRARTKK